MTLHFQSVFPLVYKRPILVAGPCSAETEAQVMETATALARQGIDLFRAGIWKPRTRPNSFEGVGVRGLKWLQRVKQETGLRVTTEVARTEHVEEALRHGIDVLWIGARTTVNPFSIQELAESLEGIDVPILIKNPINPDLKLWIGAIERFYMAGVRRIAAVHRGFSYYGETEYRNMPHWQIALDLKHHFPDLTILCDHSHICGRRDILSDVAQKALDLNFDGIMTEVHPDPDEAWSDAEQQITPAQFEEMIRALVIRSKEADDPQFMEKVEMVRNEIDSIDDDLLQLLAERMRLAERIGYYKKSSQVAIFQPSRWNEILESGIAKGKIKGLSEEFLTLILKAIHQESIHHQDRVMNAKEVKC